MSRSGEADAPDRDAVLALIRENPGAYGKRELARSLRLTADQKIELKQLLRALEHDGVIEKRGKRGYAVAGAPPNVAVIEVVDRDADGELMARWTAGGADAPADIRIPSRESAGGRHGGAALGLGDRALARIVRDEDGGAVARVIKKLGKEGRRLLGVVREDGGRIVIAPVDVGVKGPYALEKEDVRKAKVGDLVACTPLSGRSAGPRRVRIVETVGRADGPKAATLIALHAHGVPDGFDEDEARQAETVAPVTLAGREDLTDIPLITIDPSDARDHDDAVWAAPDEDPKNPGGWVVMVAIADVAAYVVPGSALDRGAEERGNSVYFPDRVAPMLPERLSTDLCSLRPNEARPCFAVRMVFSAHGEKRGHKFVRGWMRSAAKLAYEEFQAAIDGAPNETTQPLLEPVLKPLWNAYQALAEARDRRQPLDIDAPERRVRIDENGHVAEISRRERLEAHRLIEEMMIQANVCAAETLEKKRQPLIYRVHDAPSPEKLDALADFLPETGLRWTKGEVVTPARFNRLLMKAKEGDNADVVNEMVLRTQSQAVYSPENIGHFGLHLSHYAHFTSPIRRYADLIVHRALIKALRLGDDGLSDEQEKRLHTIAERISFAERRAMAAERDAMDRYLAAYLSDRIGAVFEGRVTGVTRAGLFVRLNETGADGLAPISLLGRERFHHDARAHALIGEETGGRYRLGMQVEARLMEAAPITGGLLFEIETPAEPGPKPKGRARNRPHRPPPRRKGRRR